MKINGKLFIIPNSPATKQNLGWYNPENWDNWAKEAQSRLNNFEGNLTVEEPMIQVWATNKDCDNFADHIADYQKMIGADVEVASGNNRFPTHLPLSLLNGLKENDTLVLHLKRGIEIELTLSQTTTRYRRFGNFEDVLESIL